MSETDQWVMTPVDDLDDIHEISEQAFGNVGIALAKKVKGEGLTKAEEEILDLSCEFLSVVKLVQCGVDFDAAVAKFAAPHTWRLRMDGDEISIDAEFEESADA